MAGKVDLAVGERAEDLGEGDSVVAAARAQHAGPKPARGACTDPSECCGAAVGNSRERGMQACEYYHQAHSGEQATSVSATEKSTKALWREHKDRDVAFAGMPRSPRHSSNQGLAPDNN
eukprot:1382737-Pleurochrysis_carterae.AAC.1